MVQAVPSMQFAPEVADLEMQHDDAAMQAMKEELSEQF